MRWDVYGLSRGCLRGHSHTQMLVSSAGTVEYPGRILIMTSNYPERLDKALVRKGRVDLSLRMKKASAAITKEMYENFYDDTWPEQHLALDYEFTPAEISAILYNNFDSPASAVRELGAGQREDLGPVHGAPPPPEHLSDEVRIKRLFGIMA